MSAFAESKLLEAARCWLADADALQAMPDAVPTSDAPPAPPESGDCVALLALARRNRMSPLLATAPDSVLGGMWSPARDEAGCDYKVALLSSLGCLATGVACCKAIEAAGVPVVGIRGAFDAVRWRGDAAFGLSADVDVLVPPASRGKALRALEAEGWGRRGWTPAWVETVNHYHWTLVKAGAAVACDLHWAMHHRYRLHSVDYAGICNRAVRCDSPLGPWRGPTAEDAFLLGCLRMERESPFFWAWPDPESIHGCMRRGELRPWFDLAAIMRKGADTFDWDTVLQRANAWNMADETAVVVTWLGSAFVLPMPEPVQDWAWERCRHRASHGLTATRWWKRVSSQSGPAGVFVKVALPYVWPVDTQLGRRRGWGRTVLRIGHAIRAVFHLLGGAVTALMGVIAGRCRREPSPGAIS